jgi:hypothetical protein
LTTNWSSANTTCTDYGYDSLAKTVAATETSGLRELVLDAGGWDDTWIGLSDLDHDGTWTWMDGTEAIHEDWGPGEPSSGEDNCVEIYSVNDWTWNDRVCAEEFPFACEVRSPAADADGDGYTAIVDCDDGNPDIHPFAGDVYGDGEDSDCDGYDCDAGAYGDAYFQICAERSDWNTAQDSCIARGFDGLVTITTAEEEDFLQSLPSPEYFDWASGGFGEGYRIWSGFKTGGAGWVSGLPTTYTNFNPGEPSGDGPCVEMSASVGWNDVTCGTAMPYICESR